jgi:hypothetical protein
MRTENGETKAWVAIIVALIGLVGVALPVFWNDIFKSDKTEFRFTVTVQVSTTLEPVKNAKILLSVPGETPYIEYTDSNGIASLNIPAQISGENGRFLVTADGFEAHDRNLTIRKNQLPAVVRVGRNVTPKISELGGLFKNINGVYRGVAEGFEFRFCIQRQSKKHVIGSIYFTGNPETSKVYLDGKIDEDTVNFTYHRYQGHPRGPDSGKAVLVASNEIDRFSGYWVSKSKPDNRERWELYRLSQECALKGWVGELGNKR